LASGHDGVNKPALPVTEREADTSLTHGEQLMITRAAMLMLALVHILNGLWMLLAPMSWYAAIPGVAATEPLNHHFVADIGLAFIASGAAGFRSG
jgi:uncharacterized protein YjeT (DUF2065 family)